MLTIFIRTVIIYILLLIMMRLMGKRQLGELEISELVITILLSEIASLPITNTEIPLAFSIIPIAALVSFEVITSTLVLKFPKIKRLLSSRPSVIIYKGRLDYGEMQKVRISIEELISQIRQNGIFDLDEVDYAILEENGKMSIIPKRANRQPDFNDLQLKCKDSGVMHIVISDGAVNDHNLKLLGIGHETVAKHLKKTGIEQSDVVCMTINDAGKVVIIRRDGSMVS